MKLEEALASVGLDASQLQVFAGEGEETIRYLPTTGASALKQWRQLRALVDQTGYWPVIMGEGRNLDILRNEFSYEERLPIVEILRLATEFDPLAVFEELRHLNEPDDEEYVAKGPPRGKWPTIEVPQDMLLSTRSLQGRAFLPQVFLSFAPTKISWQVPAYMRFAAANFDMYPQIHCAVLKRWQELYSAEVIAITGDVIELTVEQAPHDRATALQWALEQYAYCPDIVDQGVGTVDKLAATLLACYYCYFWWD